MTNVTDLIVEANSSTIDAFVDNSTELFVTADMIKSSYAHYIIFGCSVFALAWAGWCTLAVSRILNHCRSFRSLVG